VTPGGEAGGNSRVHTNVVGRHGRPFRAGGLSQDGVGALGPCRIEELSTSTEGRRQDKHTKPPIGEPDRIGTGGEPSDPAGCVTPHRARLRPCVWPSRSDGACCKSIAQTDLVRPGCRLRVMFGVVPQPAVQRIDRRTPRGELVDGAFDAGKPEGFSPGARTWRPAHELTSTTFAFRGEEVWSRVHARGDRAPAARPTCHRWSFVERPRCTIRMDRRRNDPTPIRSPSAGSRTRDAIAGEGLPAASSPAALAGAHFGGHLPALSRIGHRQRLGAKPPRYRATPSSTFSNGHFTNTFGQRAGPCRPATGSAPHGEMLACHPSAIRTCGIHRRLYSRGVL